MRLAASSRRMAVHGKCVRWVLIVLFCLVLRLVGPVRAQSSAEGANISTPSCNDEYLITVENTTEGIIVNVLNKRNSVLQYQKFEGRYLSSECGEHYFRCKDLFVMSSTSTVKNKTILYHIVFVPLHDGILLLKYLYNGASLSKTDDYFLEISIGCSPTFITEISENIFAVCLNQEKRNATVLRVYLDSTSIEHSRVSSPLIISNGLTNLSDFKYINSDDSNPNDQQIVFASSNYILSFAPLSYLYYPLSILGNCSVPGSLAYAPDDVLLVYCHDDSAVYFNLSHGHAINQTQYSEHGQPFLCPNPDVQIAVFASASYVQYTVWSNNSRENFNIHDMKFDSGVCVGSIKHALFAYNDKDKGVYVLDTATSNLARLSSKACLNSQCEPLQVFQNRYIAIREREKYDANVIVVDSQQNYATVITAEHVKADLLTLLIEQDSSFCSLTNGSLNHSTPSISPPSVPVMQIVGSVAGVGVALLIVVVVSSVIVTAVCKRHRKKGSCSRSVYSQETSDMESQSSELQNDGEQQDEAENSHNESVMCLNAASHGNPAFQRLQKPNQVYEVSTNQPPPKDQQNDPYTQGSSDVNHNTPVTGGDATSSELKGAATSTTPEQDTGSQQASAHSGSEASNEPMEQDGLCTSADSSLLSGVASNPVISNSTYRATSAAKPKQASVRTNPGRESLNKPNEQNRSQTFLPSASAESNSIDRGDEAECRWVSQPESEESKGRKYESNDELIPGSDKAVPPRKSPSTVRPKRRQKRAEGGNYKQL